MKVMHDNPAGWDPEVLGSYWRPLRMLGEGLVELGQPYQIFVEYKKPWIASRFAETVMSYEYLRHAGIIMFYRRYGPDRVIRCPYKSRNIARLWFRPVPPEEEGLHHH